MKKINLKSKKLQPVKDSQKISRFFLKPPNIPPGNETVKSETEVDGDQVSRSKPCTNVLFIESDDDVIPCTPNVQPVKKNGTLNHKKPTAKEALELKKRKHTDYVDSNDELKKRKHSDSTNPDDHTRVKKCNRNLLTDVINTSPFTGDNCDKQNCKTESDSTIIILDENNVNFVPAQLSPRRSPQVKNFPEKETSNKPEQLQSKSPCTKQMKTPKKSKKTPQKLFEASPNAGDFKVEVLENFVKITPSKSNKKAPVNMSSKSSEKKLQSSILEYISPSKSNRSVEAQKENESTPTKSPVIMPSTSKAKVKLDFSFDKLANSDRSPDKFDKGLNGGTILHDVSLLSDMYEEFKISSQDDYLLDLSEMQLCTVIGIVRKKCSLNLVLQSTKSKEKGECILGGFWIYSKLNVGCSVYICAFKDNTKWRIDNEHGLLVYEPDILISSTSIVGAVFCKRRSILKERFFGFEPGNKAMVVGVLVHTLLERVLKSKITTISETEKVLKEILASKETISLMYASSVTAECLETELLQYISRIVAFMNCYVLNQKTTTLNRDNWQGNIDSVLDIEENIWCRELGIKGKVDVSIQHGSNIMPLELKTGRATVSLEHRGQVMLYIMLMSKLGYKASSGLLLYLKEGILREIPINAQERRDLILLRNELTYYLTRKAEVKKLDSCDNYDINAEMMIPEFPEPINHHSACSNCPYNTICCSYIRYEKTDLSNKKPLQLIKDEVLAHLSDAHIQYFVRWSNLLDLESTWKTGKDVSAIYTQTAEEREKDGKCIIFVKVMESVFECDGFYKHIFQKADSESTESFLMSGINEGSYVIVSTTTRPAVAAGMVTYLDHKSITIALERDLTQRYADYMFHLDSYDSTSIYTFNFTNLALLLEPTKEADRLRRLIIDGETPTFQNKFPKTIAIKATPILRRLNKLQQRAVLKALAANDYLLIKGMPGTGKTATIVALVQLLTELNQTVLITSHTHMAVDNVCIRLKDCGISFLRLGAESKIHPTLQPMSEYALTKDCKTPEELEKVYNSAKVVAVTCMGSKHPLLSKRTFDVCIVDESTQVLQCSVFRALSTSKKFVLIGDPDQLPPVVRNREAIIRGFSESLFEKLQQHSEAIVILTCQYRMNKTIMDLANALTYQGHLLPANSTVANATLRLNKLESFLAKYRKQQWIIETLDYSLNSAVKVLDTDSNWNLKLNFPKSNQMLMSGLQENEAFSCTNPFEAVIILNLVNALINAEVPTKSIGVISPYRAQVALILSLLKGIDVSTVDQFQGQDKDIIIYSCTKSRDPSTAPPITKFDILEDKRRLTVAITRAKHKLILIGDLSTIRLYSPFSQLLKAIESRNMIRLKEGEMGFSWESLKTEVPYL